LAIYIDFVTAPYAAPVNSLAMLFFYSGLVSPFLDGTKMLFGQISMVLVLMGACLLTAGLIYTRRIVSALPGSSLSWNFMFCLILFFLSGYLLFTFEHYGLPATPITMLVSMVFFGGGFFVLVVTNLSFRTIEQVRQLAPLERENIQIKGMQRRIETILNTAAEGIITFDHKGMVESLNHAAERLFGYTTQEATAKSIQALIPLPPGPGQQQPRRTAEEATNTYIEVLKEQGADIIGIHKNGAAFPISITVGTTILEGAQIHTAVVSDISERKQAEENRKSALTELNQIFNSAADGMCLISTEFKIMRVNETYEKLFGLRNRILSGQLCHEVFPGPACHSDDCPLSRIKAGENRVEIECVKEHANGTPIPIIITATPFLGKDGSLIGIIEDYKDITDRKQLESRLHEISITDELTGLLNRRGFLTMAEKQLLAAHGGPKQIYLLYADLDNMKWINDTFGHKMGDQALIETTAILKNTFRNADVVGRLGGDEFVVLLSETSIQDRCQAIINRFEEAIRQRNAAPKNKEFTLQISVGISQYNPTTPCSLEDLLNRADARMYACKHSRKHQSPAVVPEGNPLPGDAAVDCRLAITANAAAVRSKN